ncbi:Hypothetical predicted protein, partial [Marmota monax]
MASSQLGRAGVEKAPAEWQPGARRPPPAPGRAAPLAGPRHAPPWTTLVPARG